MPLDPRYFQIATLSLLLAMGVFYLQFDISIPAMIIVFSTTIATQFLAYRALNIPSNDMKSPLITALSLCILLRASSLWVLAVAAIIAIASKFLVRISGKHIFNPANIAIVLVVLTPYAWISPGQWGTSTLLAFGFACLAVMVLTKSTRLDVAIIFLSTYAALVIARALWLGDPMEIPAHQLKSGALLLFAFFMITDPKTTPNHIIGRWLFAIAVAVLAFTIQFLYHVPTGLLFALPIISLLVPVCDRVWKAKSYHWHPLRKRTSS